MRKYTIKNPNEPASSTEISALAKRFSWVRGKRISLLNDKFMVV